MNFDKEKVWNKIDPILREGTGSSDRAERVRFLEKHGIAHTHNILTADILESQQYRDLSRGKPQKEWEEVKELCKPLLEEVLEYQKDIKVLDLDVIKFYTDMCIQHIGLSGEGGNQSIRFNTNPVTRGALYNAERIWPVIQIVEKYKDDPETNGYAFERWGDITQALWLLTSANLEEEVLYMTDVLLHHVIKVFKYGAKNRVFGGPIQEGIRARVVMSLCFARAEIFKKNNKIKRAKGEYETIVSEWSEQDSLSTLVSSRVTEALIGLYLLEPTEYNKGRVVEEWCRAINYRIEFAHEELREKCLITYMMGKHIFGYKLK